MFESHRGYLGDKAVGQEKLPPKVAGAFAFAQLEVSHPKLFGSTFSITWYPPPTER